MVFGSFRIFERKNYLPVNPAKGRPKTWEKDNYPNLIKPEGIADEEITDVVDNAIATVIRNSNKPLLIEIHFKYNIKIKINMNRYPLLKHKFESGNLIDTKVKLVYSVHGLIGFVLLK